MSTTRNWFKEFEFDLPAALLKDLVVLFDGLVSAPLDATHVDTIPEEQGVYQLFLDNDLVYIGKTDSEAGLHKRLDRHARKILQRSNLDPSRVTFKATRIFVFTAVDLEAQLIRHYQAAKHHSLAWNLSGFGSNDPGRERDTTKLKDGHFDLVYPVDIDTVLSIPLFSSPISVSKALTVLRGLVPYKIRSQGAGGRKPHADLDSSQLTLPAGSTTAREMLRKIQAALGQDWLVTVLPGYVIIYKENTKYTHARTL